MPPGFCVTISERRCSRVSIETDSVDRSTTVAPSRSERGIDFSDASAIKRPLDVEFQPPDQVCLILYTSGSTGTPKGVVHCQQALSQAVFNMMFTGMLTMTVEGGLREFAVVRRRRKPC